MDQNLDSNLIRSVSRSFSLTLLALPKCKRHAVGLTYLLARFADTLTDSGKWPIQERIAHLGAWENAILRKDPNLWILKGNVGSFQEAEAHLLLEGPKLLAGFKAMAAKDQHFAEDLLRTLISGMKWDLKTFASGSQTAAIFGCRDLQTFEWYCHSIAGCVGPYWVKTFGLPQTLENLADEYGKGLQRINILRDVVEDWNRGRVYLPESMLRDYGLNEGQPWKGVGWPDFLEDYLRETRKKMRHGAHFCDALPKAEWRLRWASMMPLKIGLETLALIERERNFSDRPMKISRSRVKMLAWTSFVDVALRRSVSRGNILKE